MAKIRTTNRVISIDDLGPVWVVMEPMTIQNILLTTLSLLQIICGGRDE